MDIISNLPIGLIGEIHSHLPWKEVVKTSILSKKWRSIWYSHPIIWLDETDFGADYTNYSSTDKPRRDAFFTHMMELLEIRERNSELDYSVNKLFLRMTLEYDPSAEHLVNKWISFALEKKVRMICLGLKKINRTPYYLRGIAFSGTELVGLTISDCHITNCSFNLPALKLLFLFAVCIKDHDFKDLIAACPRIEKLRVLDTRELHTIVVSNPHLKFFGGNLSCSNGKIRIESAEFDSLEFSFTKYVCKVEITSATTVRELTVGNANNQEALMHLINKFPLLEKLIIHDCSRLQNLHISQPNLASLVLMDCTVVQLIRLTTPKLKSLEYKGQHTNFEGIEDLEELEFVLLYLEPVDMDTYWWYKWIRDILKSCARSKHLSVICNSQKVTQPTLFLPLFFNFNVYNGNEYTIVWFSELLFDGCQVIINPKYVTHILPVTNMEHLELEIISRHGTFEEVTDELISILPDLKTLSLTLGYTTKFFQVIYNSNWLFHS